jgi:hypothetical protein
VRASGQIGDRLGQGHGAPCRRDMQVLDQPAVDHDDALAFRFGSGMRGDDLARLRHLGGVGRAKAALAGPICLG